MNEVLKSNGVKYGIILGGVGILMHLIIYLLGGITEENAITGGVIQFVFWLSYLGVRIFQCINTKKDFNNSITFKELFTTLTISITIGIFISQLFTYSLNNFIDTDYGTEMNEFMNKQQVIAMKAMKNFTEVSNQDIKEVANTDNFSIIKTGQAFVMSILISSIMNLILAAIFKSKTNPLNE
jgi:uncharacterized membrane protein YraQ (UPF0718 family)